MKHKSIAAAICGILFVGAASLNAASATPATNAGMETLTSLVGEWTATDADGKPFTSSIRLISNKTAIEETINSAHDSQMVTVYTADGERVAMTHYCSMGNQPRLETAAERPNANEFVFSFTGATNLASPNDQHMHRMVITVEDADHFTETWTLRSNGKDKAEEFHYTRKK
jgi:hypothetical protein